MTLIMASCGGRVSIGKERESDKSAGSFSGGARGIRLGKKISTCSRRQATESKPQTAVTGVRAARDAQVSERSAIETSCAVTREHPLARHRDRLARMVLLRAKKH